jgi:hypothetical protein
MGGTAMQCLIGFTHGHGEILCVDKLQAGKLVLTVDSQPEESLL